MVCCRFLLYRVTQKSEKALVYHEFREDLDITSYESRETQFSVGNQMFLCTIFFNGEVRLGCLLQKVVHEGP